MRGTAAENLWKAFKLREGSTHNAEQFETKTRWAPLDHASSNTRCEKHLTREDRSNFDLIQLRCRIHAAATAKDHATAHLERAETVISGQLHWSLSLREQTQELTISS